jgi:hypothetical protein
MIITRIQLRKIISEMAAKQPEALSDRFHWEVRQWDSIGRDDHNWDGYDGDKVVKHIFVTGHVDIGRESGPSQAAHISLKQKPWSDCPHWEVKNASVNRYVDIFGDDVVDLGPMMYDIAMELAGDAGLISDSGGTSAAAQRVWDFYLDNRVGVDVEVRDLAPRICGRDDRDNLAFRSKAYYKKSGTPSVIDHLKSLGKLRYL